MVSELAATRLGGRRTTSPGGGHDAGWGRRLLASPWARRWTIQTFLSLLLASFSQSGLDAEVEDYVDRGSPRFSQFGANLMVQVNVWLPVANGDVRFKDTRFDIREDLDVGVIKDWYTGFAFPGIGAAFGTIGALPSNSVEMVPIGAALGALAGVAVAPSLADAPVEFLAQWNWRQFGIRGESFFLEYETDDSRSVRGTFDVAQVRIVGMWTFYRTPESEFAPPMEPHGAAFSLLAGLAWAEAKSAVVGGFSGKASSVLPQVGVLFEGRAASWAFEIQVAGGAVGDDFSWDVRGSVAYYLAEWFGIRMGYRFLDATLADSDFEWDGNLHGLYFGLSLNF